MKFINSLVCVLALCAGSIAPVGAATFTVTSNSDSGAGTLRKAIADANSGDTIAFASTMTIALNTQLTIDKDLTIEGNGSTLDGQNNVRVLQISRGTVAMSDIHIVQGNDLYGGGIYLMDGATLSLTRSVLRGNKAVSHGAAIYAHINSTLTIAESTIESNWAPWNGGGLLLHGTATVTGSTWRGNTGQQGGAIDAQSSSTLTAVNNTFTDNEVTGVGGAITLQGTGTLVNNSFTGNVGTAGGAITSHSYHIQLHNNLFADNQAIDASRGGAVHLSLPADLQNNLFYNNQSNGVVDDTTGYGSTAPVLATTHPVAGSLANHGGPTRTLMLAAGSAALCAGNTALLGASYTTDQRGAGFPRLDGTCLDIGAVQRSRTTSTAIPSSHPIPTLSPWMLTLLTGLVALWGGRRAVVARG